MIDDRTTESDLDALGGSGFCGVRINAATAGINDPAVIGRRLQAATERLKKRRWHIQMYTTLNVISAIKDVVKASPVPVIFDHFGWLGFAEHPAGVAGVLGCALMVIGIALISMF